MILQCRCRGSGGPPLDLLAYPNADIMASLRTDRMIAQLPNLRPSLIRSIMRPGVERAIDARTMTLVANAKVQSWIPLGFHGSFMRKERRMKR